ncbi:MAG: PQQ-binding-like beta-propeller repeat protein [Myxococcales bacterium]|nr:PQQ-binding-like beta-propeller repeat protein [Myxococcales bacterium]MCB9549355.1 PQQ-binding-like beta-propeller repeat protein [Myxococcales bacterium]
MRNTLRIAALAGALGLTACQSVHLGFAGDIVGLTGDRAGLEPGPLAPAWRRELSQRNLYRDIVHQIGGVAYDPVQGRVAVGSADGRYRCLSAADGKTLWENDLGSGGGGRPVFSRGRVYTGTDDGRVLALDAENGRKVWSYRVQGAISQEPVLVGGTLYFADGENAIYALDAETGAWRWQYRRDPPAEFALVGEAAPVVAGDRVYVGFSDGIFVALNAQDGGVIWELDLAPEHDRFQDVDARAVLAGGRVYAASAAGGIAAIDPADGRILDTLPITGVTAMTAHEDDVIVAVDDGDVLRVRGIDGKTAWRTSFGAGSGAPGQPVVLGGDVLVPFSRGGLQAIDGATGRPLNHFTPGNGIHGPVTVGRDGTAWLLSDGDVLYAFRPRR